MPTLAALDGPRTFPPKIFYPIIWLLTFALALYGWIFTTDRGPVIYIWLAIAAVALWQIWTITWIHVDHEGIRMRNIFQRGRSLPWTEITTFHEEDLKLNKRTYSIIDISNAAPGTARATRIRVTSDQVGFDALREIIREAVPRVEAGVGGDERARG